MYKIHLFNLSSSALFLNRSEQIFWWKQLYKYKQSILNTAQLLGNIYKFEVPFDSIMVIIATIVAMWSLPFTNLNGTFAITIQW